MRKYLNIRHAYVSVWNNTHVFVQMDDEPDYRQYRWFGLRISART